jgi:2-oxoglutarate ferredoxin oxidoreductase subunit alpha
MKKTIIIGGAAGEGINTAAKFIERIVKDQGLHFLSYKNYMSRVRGGYNYTTITIGDEPVLSIEKNAHLFLALNKEAGEHAIKRITDNGTVYAIVPFDDKEAKGDYDVHIADQEKLKAIKNKNAGNMACVGAAIAYLGLEKQLIKTLRQSKWSDKVNEENDQAALLGYACFEHHQAPSWTFSKEQEKMMMIGGNQAVALGALAAGVGFYSAYPMAPSTGVMTYLSQHQNEMKMLVEQAEDEIAAIMSAIGAASNGVRAMTSTSGGGFSLMVEAVGFAAVSEVPLVVCNVQRPGPATGLPTRTEQADLMFMATASQGEFARILLAPTSIEDAFYTTFRAFNLAEKYQVPVMILTDQYLADATTMTPIFDTASLEVNRYLKTEPDSDYKRYAFHDYIGTRKYPGIDDETIVMTDSHVHDEYGGVSEDEEVTMALKHKLLNKENDILSDLKKPVLEGGDHYDYLLISWGSTVDIVKDAIRLARERGIKASALGFSDVYPVAEDILDPYLNKGTKIINVEGNATNQFGKLLRMATGVKWTDSINKYDGRPFTSQEIVEQLEVLING